MNIQKIKNLLESTSYEDVLIGISFIREVGFEEITKDLLTIKGVSRMESIKKDGSFSLRGFRIQNTQAQDVYYRLDNDTWLFISQFSILFRKEKSRNKYCKIIEE